MKRLAKLIMSTTSALTGVFVLTGTAGVKVLTETSPPAPPDLLSNAGFENPVMEVRSEEAMHPDSWLTFTGGTSELMFLTTAGARSGNQAVKFVSHGVPNFYQGLVQALPVTPGERYQFSAYVKVDPTHPLKGSVTGQLSIEWHGATGNEIGRLWSKVWNASFASSDWTKFEVAGVVPPNAARAHFVMVEKGESQPVAGCVFFVDDASVVKVTEQ